MEERVLRGDEVGGGAEVLGGGEVIEAGKAELRALGAGGGLADAEAAGGGMGFALELFGTLEGEVLGIFGLLEEAIGAVVVGGGDGAGDEVAGLGDEGAGLIVFGI